MTDKMIAGIPKEVFAKIAGKLEPGMGDAKLSELLKAVDFEPTDEQFVVLKKFVSKAAELSDEDLENVAGGCGTGCTPVPTSQWFST